MPCDVNLLPLQTFNYHKIQTLYLIPTYTKNYSILNEFRYEDTS